MNWLNIKAKLYGLGVIVLTVLGLFVRLSFLKKKTERLEIARDTLEVKNHIHEVLDTIEKKKKNRQKDIEQQIKEAKDGNLQEVADKLNTWQ